MLVVMQQGAAEAQIQSVKIMFNNSAESRMATRFPGDRSDFDVFPFILVDVSLHSEQHVIKLI